MRHAYTVYFPNSLTAVTTFKTLKAAKAHHDSLLGDQIFNYQMFGEKIYFPCIKRHPVLKGNTNENESK